MLEKSDTSVNLVLEQINLGRGKHWFVLLTLFSPSKNNTEHRLISPRYDPVEMRGHNVQTIAIDVWHVTETERSELSKSSYGQFHSDDVYIIRWRYKLTPLTFGQTSATKPDIGRDRVAYWIWQGVNATPNERGISALMAVCVNEEKGPHVSVVIGISSQETIAMPFCSRSMFFKSMKKQLFFNCSMALWPFIKANEIQINRKRRNLRGISTYFWVKSMSKRIGGNSRCTALIYVVEHRFSWFIIWRISCYSGMAVAPQISRRC